MMGIKNHLLSIIKKIASTDNYGIYEGQLKYTRWILLRYLHYALEALIHGYPIHIYYQAHMILTYSPVKYLTNSQKKRYMFSSRVFGYMFYLSITGKYIDDIYFDFYIDKKLKKRIEEKLNTDSIYEFIKSS